MSDVAGAAGASDSGSEEPRARRAALAAEAYAVAGRVQGVRRVIAYEGDSVERLEPEFRAAVDDYLALCAEDGDEPEVPAEPEGRG